MWTTQILGRRKQHGNEALLGCLTKRMCIRGVFVCCECGVCVWGGGVACVRVRVRTASPSECRCHHRRLGPLPAEPPLPRCGQAAAVLP